jgi:signal transduction histidine kinase/CheY-like chemotaxis protein
MNGWFRGLPIRRKLVTMTATSTAAALLLAGGGFLTWDVVAFRTMIERDVAGQARILGENSAAALVFNDERAAGETMATLELRPRVIMGCVYEGDRLFATYHRSQDSVCPPEPDPGVVFGWDRMQLVAPVTYDNSQVGTILLYRDLADVQERLVIGFATVAGLMVVCILVALAIGSRLQRSIVQPMLQLADTARAISEDQAVERRVVPLSNDEVGVVMRAFNNMLDRIAERTDALSHANTDLQREIEERKKVEGERSLLLARERDANRLKDEFLATLSHELRTPLNAVLGWTRVLRSASVPAETQSRALESIERNARLQARLIEDLLEVSRIVTGKLRLQVRATDLAAIVDAAIDIVQPAASAKRITVRSHIDDRPAITAADPDRLQQVAWNLLSNAVKFTPPGGEVDVRLRRENGYYLTVQDNGIGIDQLFLPHVFEPFRQADGTTSREHGGLGLGLAIVRQIVELHGGTVKARSGGRGTGATFEVYFPSEVPTAGAAAKRDQPTPALPAARVDKDLLRGMRLLLVDDEQDARDLMSTTLETYGATVQTAASVREAMEIFEHHPPDVLVSDIGMPFEDGYSLIKQIRRRTPAKGGMVPAVALTAYASPGDRLAALAAGFQAHVSKPYEPSELATLVERLARGTPTH